MLISIVILVIFALLAYWIITKFIAEETLRTIFLIVAGLVFLIGLVFIFKSNQPLFSIPNRLY